MIFNPGEKAVAYPNSKIRAKIVTVIEQYGNFEMYLVKPTNGFKFVVMAIELVPLDVYTSPLYEAMKEDNETN